MGEVIVITSGKGGVGKTTTVANIGTGLAMMGKKTVVVDTDIGHSLFSYFFKTNPQIRMPLQRLSLIHI